MAAKILKAYNVAAKEAGKRAIGLYRNLSFEERQYRSSMWSTFITARANGQRAWWSGHRLFIEGDEVFPTTAPNSSGGK
jgi:hypothetical protein